VCSTSEHRIDPVTLAAMTKQSLFGMGRQRAGAWKSPGLERQKKKNVYVRLCHCKHYRATAALWIEECHSGKVHFATVSCHCSTGTQNSTCIVDPEVHCAQLSLAKDAKPPRPLAGPRHKQPQTHHPPLPRHCNSLLAGMPTNHPCHVTVTTLWRYVPQCRPRGAAGCESCPRGPPLSRRREASRPEARGSRPHTSTRSPAATTRRHSQAQPLCCPVITTPRVYPGMAPPPGCALPPPRCAPLLRWGVHC